MALRSVIEKEDMPEQMLAQLKESFSLFDKDADGIITANDVGNAMRSLGLNPSQDELEAMLFEFDLDGSGNMNFTDFTRMLMSREAKRKNESAEDRKKKIFDVFNKNKSGYITAAELRDVLKSLGEKVTDEDIKEMIQFADLDGDGKVNLEEFIKAMDSSMSA